MTPRVRNRVTEVRAHKWSRLGVANARAIPQFDAHGAHNHVAIVATQEVSNIHYDCSDRAAPQQGAGCYNEQSARRVQQTMASSAREHDPPRPPRELSTSFPARMRIRPTTTPRHLLSTLTARSAHTLCLHTTHNLHHQALADA